MNAQLTHMVAHAASAERQHAGDQARLAREMHARPKSPKANLITKPRGPGARTVTVLAVERHPGGTR